MGNYYNAWKTQYAVDFASLTTQNLNGDGNYTIDGKLWGVAAGTKANTFALTNGTGLVISPKANVGSGNPASRTAPFINIQVDSLIPGGYNPGRHIVRVVVRVVLSGVAFNAQGARLNIEDLTSPTLQGISIFKGFSASAPGAPSGGQNEWGVQAVAQGAASMQFATAANYSNDCLCLDFDAANRYDARSGLYSGSGVSGLPYKLPTYLVGEVQGSPGVANMRLQAEPVILLAAQDNAASSTGLSSVTFTHLRVDTLDKFPM